MDQLFTNLDVVQSDLLDVDFTDHKAIMVNLRLRPTSQDIDIRKMPSKTTTRSIRREAISE